MTIKKQSFERQETGSISRRAFVACGMLGVVGSLLPFPFNSTKVLAMQGIGIAAYHGATEAEHQKQFDSSDGLVNKGFRIISLSVYREGTRPLYAAVWMKGGPKKEWQAFHGASSSQYQESFNNWTSKGYRPVIITATGGGVIGGNQTNSSIFAGVFEKDSTPHFAGHDMSFATFNERCTWAKQNSYALRWAALYGGMQTLHAGIWEKVAANVKWDYQQPRFADEAVNPFPLTMPGNPLLRLSFITRSAVGDHLLVYRSDQAFGVRERHGMTSADYQNQVNALKAQGLNPFCVQAGGDPRVSNTPRFVALFRKF